MVHKRKTTSPLITVRDPHAAPQPRDPQTHVVLVIEQKLVVGVRQWWLLFVAALRAVAAFILRSVVTPIAFRNLSVLVRSIPPSPLGPLWPFHQIIHPIFNVIRIPTPPPPPRLCLRCRQFSPFSFTMPYILIIIFPPHPPHLRPLSAPIPFQQLYNWPIIAILVIWQTVQYGLSLGSHPQCVEKHDTTR